MKISAKVLKEMIVEQLDSFNEKAALAEAMAAVREAGDKLSALKENAAGSNRETYRQLRQDLVIVHNELNFLKGKAK